MLNMRVLGWSWRGTGIAPSRTTRHPHTPGTPPPYPRYTAVMVTVPHSAAARKNSAVGLESVDQLSLVAHISRSGTITEVYNLSKTGRINNHSFIPGNK